jgi:hypothetical protein
MHAATVGRAETLAALAEINEECLSFWADEQMLPVPLGPAARKRAARCPFPLVDLRRLVPAKLKSEIHAGLAPTTRLGAIPPLAGRYVFSTEPPAPQGISRELAQLTAYTEGQLAVHSGHRRETRACKIVLHVLMVAWHIARCRPSDSRLLLGLSFSDVANIAASAPSQLTDWAEQGACYLTPRWSSRAIFWERLAKHAATERDAALEEVHLCGLQFLILDHLESCACA